jgi:BA14K-like protein
MKDMQTHAKKLRSDAAECLILSNLVTEERRALFARIAEHLNSLALEIETEPGTKASHDASAAPPDRQVDLAPHDAVPIDKQGRSWLRLTLSLPVALIVIVAAGTVFFSSMNRAGTHSLSFASLLPGTEPPPQDAAHQIEAFLSEEREGRKAFGDQLTALIIRIDGLAKKIDDLKSWNTGSLAPSSKGAIGQEDRPSGIEAEPPSAEERNSQKATTSTPSAPFVTPEAATNSVATTSQSSDEVGTVSLNRAELDPRKPNIGPAGCTRFRSFDSVSGTYTTFDGRRRPCR